MGFISAVVPPRVWLRMGEMPQDVRFVIAGMGSMKSGFASTSRVGAVVTAQEEFRSVVTDASRASNRQPDDTRPSGPTAGVWILANVPGGKMKSRSDPMLYSRIC